MKLFKSIQLAFVFMLGFTAMQAQMVIGPMTVGQGATDPSDWQDYFNLGIYVDVNTSGCGFPSTPHYLVTLESTENGYNWAVSGVPSIYFPTSTGFRVYLRWTDHPTEEPTIGSLAFANPLRAADAEDRGFYIRWTGILLEECAQCGDNDEVEFPGPEQGFYEEERRMAPPIPSEFMTSSIGGDDVRIYPNPGHTEINVSAAQAVTKCELININGTVLATSEGGKVNISSIPSGNYIIKVYSGDQVSVHPFVKSE